MRPRAWWPARPGGAASSWRSPRKEARPSVKPPCRICHCVDEGPEDPLVAPCRCSGSLRYVHNSCQRAWLRARRGPLEYTCELCGARLACHLRLATRVELIATLASSVAVWAVQLGSALRIVNLVARLVVVSWISRKMATTRTGDSMVEVEAAFGASDLGRQRFEGVRHDHPLGLLGAALLRGGRPEGLPSPEPSPLEVMANHAVAHIVVLALVIAVAQHGLHPFGRPLMLTGEGLLSRITATKISCCVLALLHEVLWAFPPVQRIAQPAVWRVLCATLVFDSLLLAFVRMPREERRGGGIFLWRLAQGTCRATGDFLPFAAVLVLWSTSALVIGAASLLPALALLFRRALLDLRRRRHRHGSVQLAALALRLATRLAAIAGPHTLVGPLQPGARNRGTVVSANTYGELNISFFWFALEVYVAVDLWVLRRGLCCKGRRASQAMWGAAVLGSLALAVLDHTGPARAAHAGARGGLAAALQYVALLLCVTSCLRIHNTLIVNLSRQAWRAAMRMATNFDPDGVVFCDSHYHRGSFDEDVA